MKKVGVIDRPTRGARRATDGERVIVREHLPRIAPKFLGQLQECQGRSHDTGQPQAFNPLTESQLSATVAPPAKQRAIASQEMHAALRDALLASIVTTDPTVLQKSSSTFSSLSLRGRNRAIMAHVACFRQRYRKAPCLAHGPLWARGG
jgi:restriction endonuclease Mrr